MGRMAANDPLARKQQADLIVDRAAQQLQQLLHETAKELRPFPPFPGAFFTNAVEVNLEGVETGAHVLGVSAPEFFEARVTLPATELQPLMSVPLKWKPAQVIVSCEAPGAAVRVGARTATKHSIPGAAVAIPVPPDSETGEFTVEVAASAAGHRPATTTVTVRAGRTTTVRLPLRRAE